MALTMISAPPMNLSDQMIPILTLHSEVFNPSHQMKNTCLVVIVTMKALMMMMMIPEIYRVVRTMNNGHGLF